MIQEQNKTLKNKNVGIISYITRISLDSLNVRSVDLFYLREYLLNVLDANEVDFISKKSKKEKDIEYYKNIYDTDLNYYDELYIYNGGYNIIGGRFPSEIVPLFEKLNKYNGKLYYVIADPKFPNLDAGKIIKNRLTKDNMLKVEHGFIKVDPSIFDNFSKNVFPKINVAFTGIDYKLYYDELNNKVSKLSDKSKEYNKMCDNINWVYLDLFGYYATNENLNDKLINYNIDNKIYDFVYFGNNRSSQRFTLVKNLCNDESIKKLFIGYDPKYLKNYEFIKYVKHKELFNLIGSKCLTTLIVGDDLHNNNIKTARFYEGMLLDVVAFIYIKFDEQKKYVKNEFLKKFIYVSSKEELIEKINKLKSNKDLYKKIVELEREEILKNRMNG